MKRVSGTWQRRARTDCRWLGWGKMGQRDGLMEKISCSQSKTTPPKVKGLSTLSWQCPYPFFNVNQQCLSFHNPGNCLFSYNSHYALLFTKPDYLPFSSHAWVFLYALGQEFLLPRIPSTSHQTLLYLIDHLHVVFCYN